MFDACILALVLLPSMPSLGIEIGSWAEGGTVAVAVDSSRATAATPPSIAVRRGTKVRLLFVDSGTPPVVGTYFESTADSIVVLSLERPKPIGVSAQTVRSLEQSIGIKRHRREGSRYGALIGIVAGVTYGVLTAEEECQSCETQPGCRTKLCRGGAGFMLGLLGGTIVGGIVGGSIETEVWQPVSLPRYGFSWSDDTVRFALWR